MTKIPISSKEAMAEMNRMAMEFSADYFATMAEKFATEVPDDLNGRDALTAFAQAMRNSSAVLYPKGPASS